MLKFISRIRFLPITICAAVLMLSAKLGSLAGDMDDMMSEFLRSGMQSPATGKARRADKFTGCSAGSGSAAGSLAER